MYKKLLSFLLCAAALLAFPGFCPKAEAEPYISRGENAAIQSFYAPVEGRYTVGTSHEPTTAQAVSVSMLQNPYYKKYYNSLLDYSYELCMAYDCTKTYDRYFKLITEAEPVADTAFFCTVIIAQPESLDQYVGAVRDYNLSILKKYFTNKEIIYVGDNSHAAVVQVTPGRYKTIGVQDEVFLFADAFVQRVFTGESVESKPVIIPLGHITYMDGLDAVTAADARYILMLAAGLWSPDAKDAKVTYFCADVNGDSQINAADARLALRTAAKLQNKNYIIFYHESHMLDSFVRG